MHPWRRPPPCEVCVPACIIQIPHLLISLDSSDNCNYYAGEDTRRRPQNGLAPVSAANNKMTGKAPHRERRLSHGRMYQTPWIETWKTAHGSFIGNLSVGGSWSCSCLLPVFCGSKYLGEERKMVDSFLFFFCSVSLWSVSPCECVFMHTHTHTHKATPLVSWRQMKHWAPLSWTDRTPTVPLSPPPFTLAFSRRLTLRTTAPEPKAIFKDDSRGGLAFVWRRRRRSLTRSWVFSAAFHQIIKDGRQLKWPLVALTRFTVDPAKTKKEAIILKLIHNLWGAWTSW